jgi:hypothetical protein
MNDLVDRIANGDATLLGVDDICKRLGVSRSTFDRWVRNGVADSGQSRSSALRPKTLEDLFPSSSDSAESALKFPPPDIRIGNSPKWEIDTFKRWLTQNVNTNQVGRN